MDNTKNLRVIFTGDSAGLERSFATVASGAETTGRKLESVGSSLKSFGSEASALGSTFTKAFTLPIVGVGVAAAKMAVDFQQQMTYVRTDAGDTTDNIDKLSNSVLNLAKTSQFGPDELAKGLYHIASLGLRGADAMNALNTAQQMASVGGSDLESTATALGGALVTGIQGVQNYSDAAGTLDAIIGAGNMRMQDLVGAIGTGVLPVFKNAGLTLTDFGAALATLTDNGQQADAAATHLRMTIALMEAPSKKAQGVLKDIGMTSTQMAMDMQTKGLIPALEDLKQHLLDTYGTTAEGKVKMAQALTEMFGGGRSSAAIQTLVDELDRVSNKETQIGQQTSEFSTKVGEQQESASARLKTAWSSVQADLIQLGSKVLPVVADDFDMFVHKLDELKQWWDNLSDGQQHMIKTLGEYMIVAGPALSILGKFASTFGTLYKLSGMAAKGVSGLLGVFTRLGGGGAGIAALGEGAAGATGAFSGLATMLTGPLGIGLVASAAAAGGLYLAWRHFSDVGKDFADTVNTQVDPAVKQYQDLAKRLGVQLQNTGNDTTMLSLAQKQVANDTAMVNAASSQQKSLQQQLAGSTQTLADKQNAVADAQNAVKNAADKFGQSSPQYFSALDTLRQKEEDYNTWLNNNVTDSITLSLKTDDLKSARDNLKNDTSDLAGVEEYLNGKLQAGIGVVAQFGPAALLQVGGIQILQGAISGVIASWDSTKADIQINAPQIGAIIQGVGSTIQHVQGQSDYLNSTLISAQNSAAAIQGTVGSIQGAGLQNAGHNAGGTDYWRGGLTWINEEGPEIVNLPRGAQVIPAQQSAQMAKGNGDIHVHISGNSFFGTGGISEVSSLIYRELQRIARANGFNGSLPNIGIAPTG